MRRGHPPSLAVADPHSPPPTAGIYSDGASYGIAPGLIFSMPVTTTRGGGVAVVPGLTIDAGAAARLRATQDELLMERELAGVLV